MKNPALAVREFKKPKDLHACPTVNFTHNSEGILAFNSDGSFVLWNAEDAKLLKTSCLPKGYYFPEVWMSPDRRLAAVSGEQSTYFIDTRTLTATAALPFKSHDFSWSRNGEFVAAVKSSRETWIKTVHVFRTSDRKEIGSFQLPKYADSPEFWGETTDLIFSGNAAISTWNSREKKIVKRTKFTADVWPIGWSDDGKTFFVQERK